MGKEPILRAPLPPARTLILRPRDATTTPAATSSRPFVPHQIVPGRADAISDR